MQDGCQLSAGPVRPASGMEDADLAGADLRDSISTQRGVRVRRFGRVPVPFRVLAVCMAALAAAACESAEADDVEPLPPLERPTPEQRAGLPLIGGRWIFTGFEIPPGDTGRVNSGVYQLAPPGEFRVTTQRLDSIAGQYVRGGVAFPFTGEVRRDGYFAFVVFEPGGEGRFASGRFVRDTMWMELTGFQSAATWPPRTRAALVRRPSGAPFTRLLGGAAIVDSAAIADSLRLDSLRLDSLRRANSLRTGVAPPAAVPPGAVVPPPPAAQPQPRPAPPTPPAQTPRQTPPAEERPRPAPRRPRPEPRETLQLPEPEEEPERRPPPPPPPAEPEPLPPDPVREPLPPPRPAPRETIRFGRPPS